jgi:hypothetical protein
MINSNQGSPLIEELLASIEREYCWPSMAQAVSDTSMLNQLAGTYRDSANRVFRIEQSAQRILLWIGDQAPIRLMPSPNGILSAQIPQIKVRLAPTSEGPPIFVLTQGGRTFEAIKVPEEAHHFER